MTHFVRAFKDHVGESYWGKDMAAVTWHACFCWAMRRRDAK